MAWSWVHRVFVVSLVICSSTASASAPLLMQVEWVLQGFELSYTGFMCELLGIASALREEVPLLIVQRSSFRTGLNLSTGGYLTPLFVGDLFPKEKQAMLYLMDRSAAPDPLQIAAAGQPRSKFGPEIVASSARSCEDANMELDVGFVGGDMTRNIATTETAKQCCEACIANRLCLMWSHNADSYQCNLKSSLPNSKALSLASHTSGLIIIGDENSKHSTRLTAPRAVIFHGTTCIHQNLSYAGGRLRDVNTILIGRYMVERDSFSNGLDLNEYAVISCASVVDAIWVPTEWHVGVMQKLLATASVTGKRIRVLPEAVDTDLFDPSDEGGGTNQSVARQCSFVPRDEEYNQLGIAGDIIPNQQNRLACPTAGRFEFLSVFKWESRKGWDVLLRSYWSAFGPDDDVALRLRTYLPTFLGGNPNITSQIEQFAASELGKPLEELARVVWEKDSVSRPEIRNMYRSADAFVLPTRGEGWGVPIAEAMSMALPVIVTNFSGPTAYATPDNAYLIPILGNDGGYAVIDEQALQGLFRRVVTDSLDGSAQRRGQRARETMKLFSPAHVAEKVKEHLREEAEARGWVM